jgi:hypothetical protein
MSDDETPPETDAGVTAEAPNEGAPGHEILDGPAIGKDGEHDAERPNEGAPGHEPEA